MNNETKILKNVAITGTILVASLTGYYFIDSINSDPNQPLEAPTEVSLDIENNCSDRNTMRITPNYRLEVFNEQSFTLNDLISEREREEKINGSDTGRYIKLTDLIDSVSSQLDQVDINCPTP